MTKQLDARARRSQDALLKAGMELLNSNPEASLSDIATHAGVGRTTLYRQYETREKLIHAIALFCLETIDEVTAPIEERALTANDAIKMLFEFTMPLTQEFQFLMNIEKVAQDNAEIAAINEKQKQEMIELIEFGKKTREFSKKLPTSWVLNLIEALFYVGWVQQTTEGAPPKEAAELAFTTFSRGVSPRWFR